MRGKLIRKKQIIYYMGEAPSGVNEILSGVVRAYAILPNGSEINIAVYGVGDYFPIEAAYDISSATLFNYEALSDCRIENLPVQEFQLMRQNNPQTPFIDSKRYVGALLHVNAIGQTTAYYKVGHTLRYLGMRFGAPLADKRFVRIDIKLTQQDLANLCMLSRETVNIQLPRLKATGTVIEKAKFYAVNLSGLNKLLNEEVIDIDL